jgi:thiol-disulfide isomerase/thioredoxin
MTKALRIAFSSSLLLVALTNRAVSSDQAKPTTTRAKYEAILADYDLAMKRYKAKADKALYPDAADYSRRFVDLAASDPTDTASRDALIWVIMRCNWHFDNRFPLGEQLGRAVDLLIRHHSDDLGVARTALALNDRQSPNFDRLFNALHDRSKNREVKGIACLVLGRHLHAKAWLVNWLHREKEPPRFSYEETDESGKTTTRRGEPIFEAAYETHLRSLKPDALDRESERLLLRVIAEYADLPYVLCAGGAWADWTNRSLARKQTLGQVAEASLDELRNLAIGKPAPEIDASCLDGKTRKLSDYRGKVVVLVFWGSWCGPCMARVPHERALSERHKDRPFTFLGVDIETKRDEGLKAVSREKMTWPNFYDGIADNGIPDKRSILARYHVHQFPSMFVIDAKGVIRFKYPEADEELDRAVDELLKEAESPEK